MLGRLFLFLLLLPLVSAANCTVISSLPSTISSPGYYCINRSFSSVSPADLSGAITINADNAIFDCQGNAISGTAALDKHGIYFNGTSFSSAKNCRISSFDFGVFLDSSKNTSITNITSDSSEEGFVIEGNGSAIQNSSASNNNGNGFLIELSSYENFISNSTSSYNTLDGYAISLSSRNSITNSIADNNSAGFSVSLDSYYNTIYSSVSRNNLYGFYVFSSYNNSVSGVAVQNVQGFRLSGGSYNNTVSGTGISNSKGIFMLSPGNSVRSYSDSTSLIGISVCSSNTLLELSSLTSPRGVVIGDCANANATKIRNSFVEEVSHAGTGISFIENSTVVSYNITSGIVYIQHYLDLLSVDNSSSPIASNLFISGNYQYLNPTASYLSLPSASYRIVASEKVKNSTHLLSFNPYVLNFTRDGYANNFTSINITGLSSVMAVLFVQTATTTSSTATTTTSTTAQSAVSGTATASGGGSSGPIELPSKESSTASSSTTTTARDLMKDAHDQIERARKAVALIENPRILSEVTQLLAKAEAFLKKRDYKASMIFAQEAESISNEDGRKYVSTSVTVSASPKKGDYTVFVLLIVISVLIALSRKK